MVNFARTSIFLFFVIFLGACQQDYALIDNNLEDVWVDSFTQIPELDGVDIIWAIDMSGSMSDQQNELFDGIEAMINSLPPSDWRLNMIPISPDVVLNESQFPLVPGDTIDDAIQMYDSMSVGHLEQGFDSVVRYIEFNDYAFTWMRNDAALLVVFVSDEDDQSSMTVDEFQNWYSFQRPVVFLSSIIHLEPPESKCSPSLIDVGEKYSDATNYFGGNITDICSGDWSQGVAAASSQVLPKESLKLSHIAIEDSIRVFYNRIETEEWEYSNEQNVVFFDPVPAPGVLVEVAYLLQE